MDSHSDVDVEAETAPNTCAECGDLPGDVQSGLHGSLDVVLMGLWVTEERQQPVALGRADVALVMVDDSQHLVAVSPDDGSIGLGFDSVDRAVDQRGRRKGLSFCGFRRGRRGGEKIFSIDVVAVDGQHLTGEKVGRRPMAYCGGTQCAIEQFVDAGRLVGSAHRLTMTCGARVDGAPMFIETLIST